MTVSPTARVALSRPDHKLLHHKTGMGFRGETAKKARRVLRPVRSTSNEQGSTNKCSPHQARGMVHEFSVARGGAEGGGDLVAAPW